MSAEESAHLCGAAVRDVIDKHPNFCRDLGCALFQTRDERPWASRCEHLDRGLLQHADEMPEKVKALCKIFHSDKLQTGPCFYSNIQDMIESKCAAECVGAAAHICASLGGDGVGCHEVPASSRSELEAKMPRGARIFETAADCIKASCGDGSPHWDITTLGALPSGVPRGGSAGELPSGVPGRGSGGRLPSGVLGGRSAGELPSGVSGGGSGGRLPSGVLGGGSAGQLPPSAPPPPAQSGARRDCFAPTQDTFVCVERELGDPIKRRDVTPRDHGAPIAVATARRSQGEPARGPGSGRDCARPRPDAKELPQTLQGGTSGTSLHFCYHDSVGASSNWSVSRLRGVTLSAET